MIEWGPWGVGRSREPHRHCRVGIDRSTMKGVVQSFVATKDESGPYPSAGTMLMRRKFEKKEGLFRG